MKIAIENLVGFRYKLTPATMVKPNKGGVYAPSRIREPKYLSWLEFTSRYTDREIPISFEPDGVSNPQLMTVYGYKLDCWYLVEFKVDEEA